MTKLLDKCLKVNITVSEADSFDVQLVKHAVFQQHLERRHRSSSDRY